MFPSAPSFPSAPDRSLRPTHTPTPTPTGLPDVRTRTPVSSVKRQGPRGEGGGGGVTITTEDGASELFDSVVLATHR